MKIHSIQNTLHINEVIEKEYIYLALVTQDDYQISFEQVKATFSFHKLIPKNAHIFFSLTVIRP